MKFSITLNDSAVTLQFRTFFGYFLLLVEVNMERKGPMTGRDGLIMRITCVGACTIMFVW